MAEYKVGSMDIETQEKTYASFISFIAKTCVALILFAIFLAIFTV